MSYIVCALLCLHGAAKGISDAFLLERQQDWQHKYKKQDGLLAGAPKTGLYGRYHRTFGPPKVIG